MKFACLLLLGTTAFPVDGNAATHTGEAMLGQAGSISGTVLDSVTNQPLKSVIRAHDPIVGTTLAIAITGGDGTYVLSGLAVGDYLVSAKSAGEQSHFAEVYDDNACMESCTTAEILGGAMVTVMAGNDSAGIDFLLDPLPTISGIVTSNGIDPIAGARVQFFDSSGLKIDATGAAGAGAYTISLFPRDYYLLADRPGFDAVVFDNIICADGCDPLVGTPVSLNSGAAVTNVNFILPPNQTTTILADPGLFDDQIGLVGTVDFEDIIAPDLFPVTSSQVEFSGPSEVLDQGLEPLDHAFWFGMNASAPNFLITNLGDSTDHIRFDLPEAAFAFSFYYVCFACDFLPFGTALQWRLFDSDNQEISMDTALLDFTFQPGLFLGIITDRRFHSVEISTNGGGNWFLDDVSWAPEDIFRNEFE